MIKSQTIDASRWKPDTKDVRLGEGVYLTDIMPNTRTNGQLGRLSKGIPNKHLYTHYVAINTEGLLFCLNQADLMSL
ncbi:MAG: hypothetical protein K0U74_13105 [Alphaproteobacteria bacterium]|nr:hypothetical protein [Alphaproteobacteria bacterium]